MDYTVIKLDPEMGRRIKIKAAETGVTMKELVSAVMLAWLTAAVPMTLPQDPGAAPGKETQGNGRCWTDRRLRRLRALRCVGWGRLGGAAAVQGTVI